MSEDKAAEYTIKYIERMPRYNGCKAEITAIEHPVKSARTGWAPNHIYTTAAIDGYEVDLTFTVSWTGDGEVTVRDSNGENPVTF
jgi:hypothetical protein